MTLEEAQVLALKVLKQVMEEKLDHNNVQLAQVRRRSLQDLLSLLRPSCDADSTVSCATLFQVTAAKGFQILNEEELKEVITRTEA